jgi:simple sugar transport system ATP-binding protein
MGNANTAGRQETAAPAIELRGISKAFGPVQANKDISIRVMPGTIHGIIGENGAGKSTLMSILFGYYKADAGEIFISGQKTQIPDSQAAIAAGIGMVFQHFKLVQNFHSSGKRYLRCRGRRPTEYVPSQCARNIAPIGPRIRA